MKEPEFKVNDIVTVSATATGLGKDLRGVVTKVEKFLGADFVSVDYLEYAPDGSHGTCITNLAMLKKEQQRSRGWHR